MTSAPDFAIPSRLTFASPLSESRADHLTSIIASRSPGTILDIGCGHGELLQRVMSACPDATGVGIDRRALDIARANENAERRGLQRRVRFHDADASAHDAPADVVLNLGASQVYGTSDIALRRLYELVNPGGMLLFGDGFWEQPPTAHQLERMWDGATADDHPDLPGLVEWAEAAGFLPFWVETANRDEWEFFESGHIADEAEWLLRHPHDDAADSVRRHVNRMRYRFLSGYRGVLGFAYLLLGKPVE